MSTYTTIHGDTWDGICYKLTGRTDQTHYLMQANQEYPDTFIFSAGIRLRVPEWTDDRSDTSGYPPWKQ